MTHNDDDYQREGIASNRVNVLIVGGGVAGIEALLALRDLAGDRIAVTLADPAADFIYNGRRNPAGRRGSGAYRRPSGRRDRSRALPSVIRGS
jgi:hypothetical protein